MTHPEIALNADGCLVSPRFGDVYCNRDGVAESLHVFCAGNDLEARWRTWSPTKRPFVIAETGFGTGLNCLLAARLFERVAPSGARLVFVSTECFPLDRDALAFAHGQLGADWQDNAARLRRCWPEPVAERSAWRLELGPCIEVHLLIGPAADRLAATTFAADAWFLDGFAPSKNPEMWSPELLQRVGERTRPGGTFATFTVAGAVRRGLQSAGFELERRPGFGRKREMLTGTALRCPERPPWLRWGVDGPVPRRVQVFGAGIAGASAARAFADRGAEVQVVDPGGPAAGASRLPAAVRQPRLWIESDAPDAEFVAAAFRFGAERRVDPSGVLRAADSQESAERLRLRAQNPQTTDLAEWLDAESASDRAGVSLPFGGVWIPRGDVVDLGATVHQLLSDPAIEVVSSGATFAPDLVVLATAHVPIPELASMLPTRTARGQLLAVQWGQYGSRAPRLPVCPGGYVVPPGPDGIGWVGSSYDRNATMSAACPQDDEAVLARFNGLEDLSKTLRTMPIVDRFAGVRAVGFDRLPFVGPLPRERAYLAAYGDALRGGGVVDPAPAPFVHGIVASLAHGSRGAVTAPFAAELLAAAAFGEPLPVAPRLLGRIHAARWLARSLRRG